MRIILNENAWILDRLNPMEWAFLDSIPALASGEGLDDRGRGRLLPPPLAGVSDEEGDAGEDRDAFLADWADYVAPDLESGFAAARNQVSRDLAMAAAEAGGEDPPERVEVPLEAAEAWYSALNQARLLMNEAQGVAEALETFRWQDLTDEDRARTDPRGLLLLAQYEFYTAIQSVLLEILDRGMPWTGEDGDDGEEE